MTSRVLVTAVCRRRWHVLARVLASDTGPRIVIRTLAAGVPGGSAVHRSRGSEYEAQFERWMSYVATCDCNGGHLIDCGRLQRAIDHGEPRVPIAATM